MKRERNPWSASVAKAIKKWCGQNGYESMSRLGEELGVRETVWPSVRSGYAIANDATIYAKLFLKGMPEADPRTIPTREYKSKGGGVRRVHRAWTEEQWQEWLARQPESEHLAIRGVEQEAVEETIVEQEETTVDKTAAETRLTPQEGLTIGGVLDTFISLLGSQIGKAVAPHITQAISEAASKLDIEGAVQKALSEYTAASKPGSARVNKTDLRQIGNELFGALEPYIYGTSADRDRLQTTYGDVLQKLGPVLGILSDREPERERNLSIWLESYQVTQRRRR